MEGCLEFGICLEFGCWFLEVLIVLIDLDLKRFRPLVS
jgi:hypothetical protein